MKEHIQPITRRDLLMILNIILSVVFLICLLGSYIHTSRDLYLYLLETLVAIEGWVFGIYYRVKMQHLYRREAQLLESQERYKKFADATREGLLIHDRGVIVEVNQALAEMVGLETRDFVGRDSLFFVDDKSAEFIKKIRSGEIPMQTFEITLKHANGTLVSAETHGMDTLWHGKTMRLVKIWDLTERKKIEKALKESRERFERFAEVTREGILIHDKGAIIDFNQALSDMTGYSRSDLIGKKSDEFIDAQSLELVRKFRLEGYTDKPYEIKVKRKNGDWLPVEAHGTNFNFSGRELRVVSLWDITERKKMEQAIIESQERFKRFSEVSKEGIVIHDNGVIVDVNKAGAELMGYKPEDMVGKNAADYLDENSKNIVLDLLRTGEFGKAIELNVIRPNGSIVPIEATGAELIMNGKILRITNFWDLTARKKIEEALRKSEHSFRNLIERSPDAILIHTPEKTVYVNHAMLNLLGYSEPGELVGRFPTLFVHPEDKATVHERIKQLKNPGDYNPPQEKRFIRKDGAILYVDVASFMIYFEGVPVTVAVARDLTERKKAEEALRQSERNFRNLIEKSPDGVIIHTMDRPSKMVYVNDSMLRFLGYSKAEELMGLKPNEFIREKDLPVILERIGKLKDHGDYNPPQEKVFIRRDGEQVYAEVVSFFIHYEGLPMVAVVARDLTERKKTEESLIRMERLSTIGEMSAGMAHEIRNPLAAISVAAQILKRKKPKEDHGQLETILEQSDRLEKLVRDTLIFAKPDAVLNVGPVSVRAALESALRLSQVQFGPSHQKILVDWNAPKEDFQVNAELGRLQQIFVNLILNAYQALGEGNKIKLALKREGTFIKVSVEDNGPGITDENVKRIFEPFFTTKKTGSGLGLAVSQRIAQEYGGKIELKKMRSKGTEFIVSLPVLEGD